MYVSKNRQKAASLLYKKKYIMCTQPKPKLPSVRKAGPIHEEVAA
jgi:hypothetical protein